MTDTDSQLGSFGLLAFSPRADVSHEIELMILDGLGRLVDFSLTKTLHDSSPRFLATRIIPQRSRSTSHVRPDHMSIVGNARESRLQESPRCFRRHFSVSRTSLPLLDSTHVGSS